jgi:hypothetical protein
VGARQIDALMDAGRKGAAEEIRAAVLDVALTHHLVSKFTSLVAVDVTRPGRPGSWRQTALPGNIPEGLTGFDRLPRTATPRRCYCLPARWPRAGNPYACGVDAADARRDRRVHCAGWHRDQCRRRADAQPRHKAAQRNLLLMPGHYDGDAGSFDTPLAQCRRPAGSFWSGRGGIVRPQDSRRNSERFLRELGPRSTTARRCNRRSASFSNSTCRASGCAKDR